jgi:hypothetical protein
MVRLSPFVCALLVGIGLLIPSTLPARSADYAPPPPTRSASDARQALLSYVNDKAVLLLIRASFNVLPDSEIVPTLEDDLKRIWAKGPTEKDLIELDNDLIAESSYYLVSLRYTIEAGGAAWPKDRPEKSYEADSLARLKTLQDQLLADITSGTDPLPVLAAAQSIWALTNGMVAVPSASQFAARRDNSVAEALKSAAPWADI